MRNYPKSMLSQGAKSSDVLGYLVQQATEISAVTFLVYTTFLGLDYRTLRRMNRSENRVIKKALDLRGRYGISFWDALMNLLVREPHATDRLITESLFHPTASKSNIITVPRDRLATSLASLIREKSHGEQTLGVCSLVNTKADDIAHIPMVDFHCPPSKGNLKLVKTCLRQIGQRDGVILNSGRSYHYYGFKLLTQKEWIEFFGKCLLVSPIIDYRFIGHRLIDGWAVLRIYSNDLKPKTPEFVDYL